MGADVVMDAVMDAVMSTGENEGDCRHGDQEGHELQSSGNGSGPGTAGTGSKPISYRPPVMLDPCQIEKALSDAIERLRRRSSRAVRVASQRVHRAHDAQLQGRDSQCVSGDDGARQGEQLRGLSDTPVSATRGRGATASRVKRARAPDYECCVPPPEGGRRKSRTRGCAVEMDCTAASTAERAARRLAATPPAPAVDLTDDCTCPTTVFHANPTPHARFLASVHGMTFRSSQMERAITQAAPAEALKICVGPPGTGKTHALLDALDAFVKRGMRCLVCAPTNVGAADLHERAMRRGLSGHLALARRHVPLESAFLNTPLSRSAVVFCTICGRWGGALSDLTFDAVLVDEGARCMEARLVGLLAGAEHAFIAGDPGQLPEQVSPEGAASGYGRSLMERLLDLAYPCTTLTTQRRMHPEICSLPNRLFYDNALKTCVEGRRPYPAPHYVLVDVSEGKEARDGTSFYNDAEARVAADIARHHCRDRDPMGVVVLVAYSAQQRRVYRYDPGCAVCTVDSFQGKEADVIVLCVTRTRAEGFWSEAARVNVALTRARDRLVVLMQLSRWVDDVDSGVLGQVARDGVQRGATMDATRAASAFAESFSTLDEQG